MLGNIKICIWIYMKMVGQHSSSHGGGLHQYSSHEYLTPGWTKPLTLTLFVRNLYVFNLWHVALQFWTSVMTLVILHFSLKCRNVFTDTILILCLLDSLEMHLLLLRPQSSPILNSVSSSSWYHPPFIQISICSCLYQVSHRRLSNMALV